ncbi:MAG TPA: hypothetical protein VFF70_04065 [Anaerolineae bacterium]|jgi:hypothetical protein|nr:hypothetical protein [Anaerolineae bacterium]
MKDTHVDSDRMLFAAVLISGFVGLIIFLLVYTTILQYGTLNENGKAYARVGLYVLAGTLILSLYLALAARSRSLTTPGMQGLGWLLVFGGFILACPALGGTIGLKVIPGVTGFSGVAGAMFMIISGSSLLQAERNARDRNKEN